MFKRKLKIKSITTAATGDFLFTLGLGSDGNVYIWNSTSCQWLLHKTLEQPTEKK